MAKSYPFISVIIPNLDGENFLEKCLNPLFQEQGNFEVIVIDDNSTDNSLAILQKKFSCETRLKTISLKQSSGAAKARNIGFQKSSGQYLLFLDNDTKIKPGWLEEVINFFEVFPQTGFAQAKILTMGTNRFDYAGDFLGPFGFLIERSRGAQDHGQFDKSDKIFALKSAAMLARREAFEKVGGFDDDYQYLIEDTDIAWRAWLAGFEIRFAPKIVVWHAFGTKEKPATAYQKRKVVYRGCRNTIISLIKNLGFRRLILILPINSGCWLILAFLLFVKLDFKKGWAIMQGLFWNLQHLPKTLKKRRKIQSERKIQDKELFKMVGSRQTLSYYLGKAYSYLVSKPF